ncbi:MAG: ferrochelatase [Alphaproteobacteria bacterium]|nr:ferrochelatase [Alphaproteobacteria bacterium]
MKTAVVLLNLGGPLKREDIRPYLYRFFMDKNIIGAPLPIRWALAQYISLSRSMGAAKSAYRELGYKSPLLENTQAQADALQKELGDAAKVFISMRYWQPDSEALAKQLREYAPEHVILLPLYPQFSTTTTGSSFEDIKKACADIFEKAKLSEICCYPEDEGFIAASVAQIRVAFEEARKTYDGRIRLLFSAHGLPEKVVAAGDPYQRQCELTAEKIAEKIAREVPDLDWQICYQSRVGPMKWIGPSTIEALGKAAADKTGVIIYPHAFVSEHVETLVEIDMDYRRMAKDLGIPYFGKAETVGAQPHFISGLAAMVRRAQGGSVCEKICPEKFTRCPCKAQEGLKQAA